MAEDLNRVITVGRLVRDSELQYTSSGWAILKGSIAVNRRRKQGEQWVDEANFFDFSLFGKRGESLAPYLLKGQQIAIEGKLKQDRWEKDGVKRSKVLIEADNIQLLGGKKDSQSTGEGYQDNQPRQQQQSQQERFTDDVPY